MKKFGFSIVTGIGVVGSIITIYAFIASKSENPQLEIQYSNFDRLTDQVDKKEPDLNGIYYFKKEKVKNLWKVTITFTNTKDKTIIGEGTQKNIIPENLKFTIPKSYRLLRSDKVYSDINHILYINKQNLALSFNQWRKGEKIVYNLYFETPSSDFDKLFLKEKIERQIIDGEIIFRVSETTPRKQYISENIPPFIRKLAYLFTLFILSIFIIVFGLMLILAVPSFQKRRLWRKNNQIKYSHYLSEVFKENESLKEKYVKSPDELPQKIWDNFEGEKYPKMFFDVNNDTILEIFIIIIILGSFESSLLVVSADIFQNLYKMW